MNAAKIDDIRPRGSVEVQCGIAGCEWWFWLDPLDRRLPDGPFLCHEHDPASNVPMPKEER